MRKLLLALVIVIAPFAARAGDEVVPSAQPANVIEVQDFLGLNERQALAVGIGLAAGAVLGAVVVSSGSGAVLGGVAGALVGYWWATRARDPLSRIARTYDIDCKPADCPVAR